MSYTYANNTRSVQEIVASDGTSIWLKSGKKLVLEDQAKSMPTGITVKENAPSETVGNKNNESKE